MKTRQRFQFSNVHISHELEEPLFLQLEKQLRTAITDGSLKHGERLPSTRNLAQDLNISRNTVIRAYEQMESEGFIATKRGSGTRVTKMFTELPNKSEKNTKPEKHRKPENPSSYTFQPAERIRQADELGFSSYMVNDSSARPFRAHLTDADEFPFNIWTRIFQQKMRDESLVLINETHPLGYTPLREAIADYLGAAHGMNVNSQQVVITAGTQQATELLARVLINPGDTAAFEEPGYTPAMASCKFYGASTVSVPVDAEGINVSALKAVTGRIKFVYVTPANHFPLGMTLSETRRKDIIQWARDNDALIIEDDYNGEYRYRGRPLSSIYRMSGGDHCIYTGSFSKLLFPSLRLGYMIVPESMLKSLTTARWLLDRHSPPLTQAVLADFINQGHFARHLRRMRALYSRRHDAAVEFADRYLSGIMTVPPLNGGLHLVGWLNDQVNEADLMSAAQQAGIELVSNSVFSTGITDRKSVLIGFAPFSEKEMETAFRNLKSAYRKLTT